ncbi:MAG: nucleotidyltransferase domain-containing protein [Candidatus Latescibacteria bacterium]|jgi:predicted nucleotidyltransferase|nr:nucleotidyltransferase domain-containing protein [Candidatus Latescibacterota bacterium]
MLTLDIPEVTEDLLDQMVQTIVDKFHPQKVILFGSHAWGTPRKESDVDLLIIIESNLRPAQRSAEISIASRPRNLAVDFLVKTPAEVADRLKIGDPFLKRPLEQGRVLYAQ